jgi:hypothetical protein
MSEIKKTPVKIGGKNGIIIHDSLCADGPVDPVTGETLIDPETGKPYPGKNDDMANLLHDYLRLIRGTVNLKDELYAPRYGVLSLIAMFMIILHLKRLQKQLLQTVKIVLLMQILCVKWFNKKKTLVVKNMV